MISSYVTEVFKFSGAGNDFVVLDGRRGGVETFREAETIGRLCREHLTDGLMFLTEAPGVDFGMEFYNPDGSGGMMCGNGGRCIAAFADYLGIKPAEGTVYRFEAPDGLHTAQILEAPAEGGHRFGDTTLIRNLHWTVRLKMIDVKGVTPLKGGYFLNTGTRHFVKFVEDVDAVDMESEAKPLRWDSCFQPEGTNVNFVQKTDGLLKVRTFEKGVEGETLACGTGLTASALIAGHCHLAESPVKLQCRRGDLLEVEFKTAENDCFTDVYLTGPAELVSIL